MTDMFHTYARTGMRQVATALLTLFTIMGAGSSWSQTVPLRENAYSYSCWLNGLRKTKSDTSPTILAIETSHYGFTLDLADFSKAGFAERPGRAAGYAESLAAGNYSKNIPL